MTTQDDPSPFPTLHGPNSRAVHALHQVLLLGQAPLFVNAEQEKLIKKLNGIIPDDEGVQHCPQAAWFCHDHYGLGMVVLPNLVGFVSLSMATPLLHCSANA